MSETYLVPCQTYMTLHKKLSFPLRISSVNVTTADLVTSTEKILNGNFIFCAL